MSRHLSALAVLIVATGLLAAPPRQLQQRHLRPLLPRLEVLKAMAAPYLHLVTDYYWIQTLQAVARARTAEEYRDISDYAELVSELDPRFRPIYMFAGSAIPLQVGPSRWVNTEESTRLLEKGVQRFPDYVLLRILLAYNLTEFHQDYPRAARVLEAAARLPEAPAFLPALATRMFAQAGEFDAGLALAQSLAESASDPETRSTFEMRVLQLRLERELRRLDAAVVAFAAREGHPPGQLEDLVAAGLLDRIPEDPLGGTLHLGPDGRARSTTQRQRLELLKPTTEKEP